VVERPALIATRVVVFRPVVFYSVPISALLFQILNFVKYAVTLIVAAALHTGVETLNSELV
jgi:hypothetical protein